MPVCFLFAVGLPKFSFLQSADSVFFFVFFVFFFFLVLLLEGAVFALDLALAC